MQPKTISIARQQNFFWIDNENEIQIKALQNLSYSIVIAYNFLLFEHTLFLFILKFFTGID